MKDYAYILAAHRGDSAHYPENSLAAVKASVNAAARQPAQPFVIEADLRTSKDGDLVLMHDARTTRTTDFNGAVAELTTQKLQSLKLKQLGVAPEQAADDLLTITAEDYRIPTLTEVHNVVETANAQLAGRAQPIGLALEIKAAPVLQNDTITSIWRGVIGALRTIGLGNNAANISPPNHTVDQLIEYMNDARHQGVTPLMVYGTGEIGLRDVTAVQQRLDPKAKAHWMLPNAKPHRMDTVSLPSDKWVTRGQSQLIKRNQPFFYLPSELTRPLNDADGKTTQVNRALNSPDLIEEALDQQVNIIASDDTNMMLETAQKALPKTVKAPKPAPAETVSVSLTKPSQEVSRVTSERLFQDIALQIS